MGANTFYTRSRGRTPEEAFRRAVDMARYRFGHDGYTGSIAEKESFVMVEVPRGAEPEEHAYTLLMARGVDKWGPAGCIVLEPEKGEKEYLFFGWASS